jgi:hypothetical protein
LYQPTAAAASETINITERNGRSISFAMASNSRRHVTVALVVAHEQARRSVRWGSRLCAQTLCGFCFRFWIGAGFALAFACKGKSAQGACNPGSSYWVEPESG